MGTTSANWTEVSHIRQLKTDDHLRFHRTPPVKGSRDTYVEGTLLGVTQDNRIVILCTKDAGPKQDSRVGFEVKTPAPGCFGVADYPRRVMVRR